MNPLQISSGLQARALRPGPRSVVDWSYGRGPRGVPLKLRIGDRSWTGEGVWIHNQDRVDNGADVVLSQDTFVTTGTHRQRVDMGLITRPVVIDDGAWIISRCVVLGGTQVGRSALARPLTVVSGDVPVNAIVSRPDCPVVDRRFPDVPVGEPQTSAR